MGSWLCYLLVKRLSFKILSSCVPLFLFISLISRLFFSADLSLAQAPLSCYRWNQSTTVSGIPSRCSGNNRNSKSDPAGSSVSWCLKCSSNDPLTEDPHNTRNKLAFISALGSDPGRTTSLGQCFSTYRWPNFSCLIFRSFNEGSLKVDNKDHVNGTSAEGSKGLNLDGDSSIFIGMQ